jgi:hypothetical protein
MSVPRGIYVFYEDGSGTSDMMYVYFDGGSWSDPQIVPDTTTTGPPAVVYQNGNLYCFHNGAQGATNTLWYNVYGGAAWRGDNPVPATTLNYSPSAASYNGHIYVLHQGAAGAADTLWYNVYRGGGQWAGDQPFSNALIHHSPAAITLSGQIFCYHRNGSNQLCVTGFLGQDFPFPGLALTNSPAPIAYNPNSDQAVQCFYQTNDGSNDLLMSTISPSYQVVSTQNLTKNFAGTAVWYSPAVCAFNNRLFCFTHSPDQTNQLFGQVLVGLNWTPSFQIPNVSTLYSPSAVAVD